MAAIQGVLFDKDGTLIDFEATWLAVGDRLALTAAGGDRAQADRLLDLAGYDFATRRFRPDSVFAAGTNADIVTLWHPQLDAAGRAERLAAFDRLTTEQGAARPVPLPGVERALRRLHGGGLRLAVATNDSTAGARRTLEALGISQLFAAAYGYDSVARPKPAPDIVEAFSSLTGLSPRELAMVGDNRHDLEMARAGGVGVAIGVLSGTGTRDSLADLADEIIDSAADLPALLGIGVTPR